MHGASRSGSALGYAIDEDGGRDERYEGIDNADGIDSGNSMKVHQF